MSSPNINNVILAGCVIVYADVFVEDVTASGCVSFCYVSAAVTMDTASSPRACVFVNEPERRVDVQSSKIYRWWKGRINC